MNLVLKAATVASVLNRCAKPIFGVSKDKLGNVMSMPQYTKRKWILIV